MWLFPKLRFKQKKIGSMDRWLHKEVGLYTKWLTVKGRLPIQAGQTYLFTRAIICHGITAIPGMKCDERWHKLHRHAWKLGQIRRAVENLVHFVCKNALREKEDSVEKGILKTTMTLSLRDQWRSWSDYFNTPIFQRKLFDETFAWQYFSGFHKNTPYSPYTLFC